MDIFTDKNSGYKFCMKMGNPCADYILENGIYEYPLIRWCQQYLTKEGTFIDIGAHMGTYSVLLSRYCKEVHAFEAQASTYECLSVSVSINNNFKITTHHTALGDKEETLTLYHVSEDGGCSSVRKEVSSNMNMDIIGTETVQVKTLDSFDIRNVDFIKIDVEGYELPVIKGAVKTLENNNYPPFIFEAWPTDWYKADREKLINYIKSLGYKVHAITGVNNMYLASDHPKRPKLNKKENIVELIERYEQNKCDSFTWEDWLDLTGHFREKGKHEHAYECGRRALQIAPKDREFLIYNELCISCYYLGKKDEGLYACERVLLNYSPPWTARNATLNNQMFYLPVLKFHKRVLISCEIPEGYTSSSSSMIRHGDEFKICLRIVNYYVSDKSYGTSRDDDGLIRTRNLILNVDKNLRVTNKVELLDKSGVQLYPKNILGMEDVRIFGDGTKGENYLMTTYLELNDQRMAQMAWGTYNDDGTVHRLVPLQFSKDPKPEKNWSPFVQDDKIYFIYSWGPFILLELNKESGELTVVKKAISLNHNMNDFRGSGPPIPYKLNGVDGWLSTIHQVFYGEPRKYTHRFVWTDTKFESVKFSTPFYFQKIGIEFNLSICDRGDETIIVTYSVSDSCSTMGIVKYETIDSMMTYDTNLLTCK